MKIESSGKIKIISGTFVKGEPVKEGDILSVPADITLSDAKTLITLKRATIVPPVEKSKDAKPADGKNADWVVTKAHQKLLDKVAAGKELTEKQAADLAKFEESRPKTEE